MFMPIYLVNVQYSTQVIHHTAAKPTVPAAPGVEGTDWGHFARHALRHDCSACAGTVLLDVEMYHGQSPKPWQQ